MSGGNRELSIDKNNRLVITDTFGKKYYRENRTGEVSASSYEVAVTEKSGKKYLKKIVLDGSWELTDRYDLAFKVSGSENDYTGKTIVLYGRIEDPKASSLIFRVHGTNAISGIRSKVVELKGYWRADGYNIICFNVSKTSGRDDAIKFQGSWGINRYNEISYTYSKISLKTKEKENIEFRFKGYWVFARRRITYMVEGSTGSYFSFSGILQPFSEISAPGAIRYEVGIRYEEKKVFKRRENVVAVSGSWKLNKDFSVAFEVAYSGMRKMKYLFRAEKFFSNGKDLKVSLIGAEGEPLGVELEFRKEFNKDSDLFFSLGRFARESRIMGGVRIRFYRGFSESLRACGLGRFPMSFFINGLRHKEFLV